MHISADFLEQGILGPMTQWHFHDFFCDVDKAGTFDPALQKQGGMQVDAGFGHALSQERVVPVVEIGVVDSAIIAAGKIIKLAKLEPASRLEMCI